MKAWIACNKSFSSNSVPEIFFANVFTHLKIMLAFFKSDNVYYACVFSSYFIFYSHWGLGVLFNFTEQHQTRLQSDHDKMRPTQHPLYFCLIRHKQGHCAHHKILNIPFLLPNIRNCCFFNNYGFNITLICLFCR